MGEDTSKSEAVQRAVGRVLMVGLPATELDPKTRKALAALRPGGVIVFRRNIDTAGRLAALLGEVRPLLADPPLVAIDQEGGRVSRLEPWIGPTPPAVELAAAGSHHVFRFGRATGLGLRALGFNLDFAPVVDLSAPDAPNGIADRAYGSRPDPVTDLAGSFLDGLQQVGVAGCLKHFPGLGDTRVDSHRTLPTVWRDPARLEQEDMLPFRRLRRRAAAVMVGHGHYPALDPEPDLPATLSRVIVEDWLRRRLSFRGLVVSDDMEMGAVAPLDEGGRAAVAAVAAGCDLVLYCSDLQRAAAAAAALREAARNEPPFANRLADAIRAVTRTAARWPLPRADLEAWSQARQLIFEAARPTH